MNEFCYNLAIRQYKCQNDISSTLDNVYTNIENDTQILLSYGYILTILSRNANSVTIQLFNSDLLNNIKFNIPSDSFKTFDLPIYNGNYVLKIGVVKVDCVCPSLAQR